MRCEMKRKRQDEKVSASMIRSTVPEFGFGKCSDRHQTQRNLNDVGKKTGISKKFTRIAAAILIGSSLITSHARAELNEQVAIKAIISEAANQGLDGMTALAEAIRNRGTCQGVCGLQRESFISRQPNWVKEMAKVAWKRSASTNYVRGADHWENVEAFGMPEWAKGMETTAKIKNHTFFKSPSKRSKRKL